MKATQILMEEHRIIERVLAALESAARRPAPAEPTAEAAFYLKAADFIKGFADGCHHHKEEGVLFEALVANGFSREAGPVAVMLADHEEGRRLTRGMRLAAERLQSGDLAARGAVLENALGYAVLLRQHIMKEDRILFPMADRAIPLEQHEQVAEGFERIEHEETGAGVHEKYLGIAQELEKAVAG